MRMYDEPVLIVICRACGARWWVPESEINDPGEKECGCGGPGAVVGRSYQ